MTIELLAATFSLAMLPAAHDNTGRGSNRKMVRDKNKGYINAFSGKEFGEQASDPDSTNEIPTISSSRRWQSCKN